MPLVEYLTSHFVLKCPNYHGTEYMMPAFVKMDQATGKPIPPPTTMEELPGWQIVPRGMESEGKPRVPQALAYYPTQGLPVRLFICRECGYVEMYAGPVVAPNEWLPHG